MNNGKLAQVNRLKKQHVEAAVNFAISNIPHTDEDTLQKFLELINVTGNFGSVSEAELLEKMRLLQKYIPEACGYSLFILTELLGISPYAPAEDYHLSTTANNSRGAFMAQFSSRPQVVTVVPG